MDNHSQYDHLLTKYLLNELSVAEEKRIQEWINASPGNAVYFEQFKVAWNLSKSEGLLQKLDINEEWNYHKRVVAGGEMIMNVPDHPYDNEPGTRTRKLRRTRMLVTACIAASLVAIVSVILFTPSARYSAPVVQQSKDVDLPVADKQNIYREVNSSERPETFLLGDGSEVVLYANSELIYEKEFTGNQRNVHLKGKADFKVTSDSTKPFTVFAGDISTTVLGTQFTVTSYESSIIANVRLYEGKVIVRSTSTAAKKLKQDYVLLPGHEIIYNKTSGEAFIRSFRERKIVTGKDAIEDIQMPNDFEGSWFMFNNQALPDVFDQLQALYNVEIKYKRADLDKMYFIGRLDRADSIDQILEKICLLYQLKVSHHDN
ncbi:MAG: FecR family protein, partial [Chitinophagaceae bacterium]